MIKNLKSVQRFVRSIYRLIKPFLHPLSKLALVLLLLGFPLLLYVAWYVVEYQERIVFQNLEVSGQGDFNQEQIDAFNQAVEELYRSTKDTYPLSFSTEDTTVEDGEFKIAVKETFTDQLGILSLLPLHKACLVNRNQLFLGGQLIPDQNISPEGGALGLIQKDGYEFYARRGDSDCKTVFAQKLEEYSFRPELRYMMATVSNTDGSVSIATTSVDTSKTIFSTSLSLWTFFPFYLAVLFAWSFIFFQYIKITQFLRKPRVEVEI